METKGEGASKRKQRGMGRGMMLGDSERSIAFKVHTVEFGDKAYNNNKLTFGSR